MRHAVSIVTGGALIALTAPATALGAEAHVENSAGGPVIVFNAAPGEKQSLLVDRDAGFTQGLYKLNDQDNPVTAGPGCRQAPRFIPGSTDPESVLCDVNVVAIVVNLGDGDDTVRFGPLQGQPIRDITSAGPGLDSITGNPNGDSLVAGGDGPDSIDTKGGNDQIDGGTGNDTIAGGPGNDVVAGGAGNDMIKLYATPGTLENIFAYRGSDTNRAGGGPGNDRIEGDNGPDVIIGEDGNDFIVGSGGPDVLDGGRGNDRLDEGDSPGNPSSPTRADGGLPGGPAVPDTVHGGAGVDEALYCTRTYRGADARFPLSISLDRRANDGARGERDNIGPRGDVEGVIGGGSTDDRITGSAAPNSLTGDCFGGGRAGNNVLLGLAGSDRLVGGDGNDLLDGGVGSDRFLGNGGNDIIRAKDGRRDSSINCDGHGLGTDIAFLDRVDPAGFGCERRFVPR